MSERFFWKAKERIDEFPVGRFLQKFSYWKEYVVEKAEIRRRRNGEKRFAPRHHMLP